MRKCLLLLFVMAIVQPPTKSPYTIHQDIEYQILLAERKEQLKAHNEEVERLKEKTREFQRKTGTIVPR